MRLAKFLKHQLRGVLRAHQRRREHLVETDANRLQALAGGARFLNANRRQIRIFPAGEQILEVPVALAMADEN